MLTLKTLPRLALLTVLHGTVALSMTVTGSWTAPTTNANGTPLTDLAGYRFYFGSATGTYTGSYGGRSSPIDTTATSIQLSGVPSCAPVYYTVTALDTSGNESAFATEVAARVPARPANLQLSSPAAGSVTLSWRAVPAGDTGAIDRYFIHYGSTSGGPYNGSGAAQGASPIEVVSTAANPSATLSGFPAGTSTYFVIEAACDGGRTRISTEQLVYNNPAPTCQDADLDGYGSPGDASCAYGAQTDCDDSNPALHPGTVWYRDQDGDLHSDGTSLTQCVQPAGYALATGLTATSGDCADADASRHPAAAETLADGVDQDCDGVDSCYEDLDGDGYGSSSVVDDTDLSCSNGTAATSAQAGDCNDSNPSVHPTATEVCDGTVDDNCDGAVDEGCSCTSGQSRSCYGGAVGTAGVGACVAGTQECAAGVWGSCTGEVRPATESCEGAVDEDCDGTVDDGCACNDGQTQACYAGPAGTEGVGLCVAGTQTCSDGAWGPCTGQMLPVTESCQSAADDDCDGIANEECDPSEVLPGEPPAAIQGGCGCGAAPGSAGALLYAMLLFGLVARRRRG